MKKTIGLFLLLNSVLLPAVGAMEGSSPQLTRQSLIAEKLHDGAYTKSEALLYKVQAVHNPERLPDELRSLPNAKVHSNTALYKEIFLALQDPDLDLSTRRYYDDVTRRPTSAGFFDSDKYPVRIHYTTMAYQTQAQSALKMAEESWQKEVEEIGFLAPLTDEGNLRDDQGGNNFLDIYIGSDAAGAAGYTAPEGWNEETEYSDCYTYIVIQANSNSLYLGTTIAHEMNHAMQAAYDCIETTPFWENTATYIMDLVYPEAGDYIYYLPDFQQYPQFAFDTFSSEINFQYGAVLVPMLLDEVFGKRDGTYIRKIWERCKQISVSVNEPDYFDAIEEALAEKGVSLDEFQVMLTEYRFFTGNRNDGKHFKKAGDWPSGGYLSCNVPYDSSVTLNYYDSIEASNKTKVQQHSSSYIKINLPDDVTGNLALNFSASQSRWASKLFCHKEADDSWSIATLMMSDYQAGSGIIPVNGFDYCVLAVTNLGKQNYDPDSRNTSSYQFFFQAELVGDSLPIPEVKGISANMVNCNGYQEIVLSGTNFYTGMQVAINGHTASISRMTSEEVHILTPAIAESGLYELTITSPDGSKIAVDEVLYIGDGCSCSCNSSGRCEKNCACDPDCLYCTCDVDTACSPDCLCDKECNSCGCNAATPAEEKANFGWFLALIALLGSYFATRRSLYSKHLH